MAGEIETSKYPVKVFVWTTGRCLSNAFLKCMTNVPDSVGWHEPYNQIQRFSELIKYPKHYEFGRELIEKHGGAPAVAKIEHGYDASDKDFDWLKEQLEADYPGKSLLIVKNPGNIAGMSLLNKIPKGFRHTFLTRNPHKVVMSFLKVIYAKAEEGSIQSSHLTPAEMRRFKEMNELWKFVKEEGLESRPVIIDADDLLENPKGIMEAYCKEIGIPFTEDLLTWPAGDDYMKNCMVSKQNLLTYRTMGFSGTAIESTGFERPPNSTDKDVKHVNDALKKIPPEHLAQMTELADKELPYYEEMYAKRLTVQK